MYVPMIDNEKQDFLKAHAGSGPGIHVVQSFGQHQRAIEVAIAPGVKALGTVWLCPVQGKRYGPCDCDIS